jgi:hypothetical protein
MYSVSLTQRRPEASVPAGGQLSKSALRRQKRKAAKTENTIHDTIIDHGATETEAQIINTKGGGPWKKVASSKDKKPNKQETKKPAYVKPARTTSKPKVKQSLEQKPKTSASNISAPRLDATTANTSDASAGSSRANTALNTPNTSPEISPQQSPKTFKVVRLTLSNESAPKVGEPKKNFMPVKTIQKDESTVVKTAISYTAAVMLNDTSSPRKLTLKSESSRVEPEKSTTKVPQPNPDTACRGTKKSRKNKLKMVPHGDGWTVIGMPEHDVGSDSFSEMGTGETGSPHQVACSGITSASMSLDGTTAEVEISEKKAPVEHFPQLAKSGAQSAYGLPKISYASRVMQPVKNVVTSAPKVETTLKNTAANLQKVPILRISPSS